MQGKTDIFYEILSSRVFPLKCTANNYISHSCLQPDGCRVCVENMMLKEAQHDYVLVITKFTYCDQYICSMNVGLSWTFFENAS